MSQLHCWGDDLWGCHVVVVWCCFDLKEKERKE